MYSLKYICSQAHLLLFEKCIDTRGQWNNSLTLSHAKKQFPGKKKHNSGKFSNAV